MPKAPSPPITQNQILARRTLRWTIALVVFTAGLFIASALSDLFIYLQVVSSNNSSRDQEEQARAVIGFNGGIVFPANFINSKPTVYGFFGQFHNFGTTRTSHLEGWTSIHYFKDGVPNSQDFSKPYDKIEVPNVVVGGNSDLITGPASVGADDVLNALNERGVIVAWGKVKWADVFDRSKMKEVGFCTNLLPSKTPDEHIVFNAVPYRGDCNFSTD